MDNLSIARALHVVGVVLWIGGVSMVTTVLMPVVMHHAPSQRHALFEAIEGRFARQAQGTTLLVGATGFYMTWEQGLWDRFLYGAFWWMHTMVGVWLLFTLMLFLIEPLWLHRWFAHAAKLRPERTFRIVVILHWLLLGMSLITVAGAVIGSHGGGF
jgi:uncharacterized membrane protein